MRCLVALALSAILGAVLLAADGTPAQKDARIALLEEQVRQLQRDNKICAAQLTVAIEPQQQALAKEKLDAAAKDMGCSAGVNWATNPPVCLAVQPEAIMPSSGPVVCGSVSGCREPK